jgi:hypothetical protein
MVPPDVEAILLTELESVGYPSENCVPCRAPGDRRSDVDPGSLSPPPRLR